MATTKKGASGGGAATTLMGISLGLGLLEGITSASRSRKQAYRQTEFIWEQMNSLRKEKKAMGQFFEEKEGLVTDRHRQQFRSLTNRAGYSLEDTQRQAQQGRAKSGFSYSGQVEQLATTQERRIKGQYEGDRSELDTSQTMSMLDLIRERESTMGDIDARFERSKLDLAASQEAENERFLGIF